MMRTLVLAVLGLVVLSTVGTAPVTATAPSTGAAGSLSLSEPLTSIFDQLSTILDTIADVLHQLNRVLHELSQLFGGEAAEDD